MTEVSEKLNLSHKQWEFLKNANASYNISSGVTKSGKTFCQILKWYGYIYNKAPKNSLLLMTGRTSETLYDNVIRDLIRLNPRDLIYTRNPGKIRVISKGIDITCIGCDTERAWGRIQGKGVWGWLADEIVQHPREVVDIGIAVCSAGGQIHQKFWTCNPDSPTHYIKTNFIDNDKIDRKNFYFGFPDNPVMSAELLQEFQHSFTGVFYERMILGHWVSAEGTIYDKFNRSEHVIPRDKVPWDSIDHYEVGADWGYEHRSAFLLYAIESDGTFYQVDEFVSNHQTVDESIRKALEYRGWYDLELRRWDGQKFSVQKTKPYMAFGDSARPEYIAIWNGLMDYPMSKAVKDNKEAMIHSVQLLYLKKPNGKYGIYYVDGMCKETLKEKESYRWRKNTTGKDEPIKENDDTQDAEQYFVYMQSRKMDFSKLNGIKVTSKRFNED